MKVPSEIAPCPITESIMEVRFDSNFDESVVFGIIYSQIKAEYLEIIKLPILEMPPSLRTTDPNLKYIPYYRIVSKENKNTLIQIGPKVFSVVITNDYPGWRKFLDVIEYGLQKLESSGVVSKITRFSLRYINFFSENILLKSNLAIQLNNSSLNYLNTSMRIEIPDENFLNILSVSNNAIKQSENEIIKGSIIDIDTVMQVDLPNFFTDRTDLLESCHKVEKKLFASLLSEEYVKTLNKIKYA